MNKTVSLFLAVIMVLCVLLTTNLYVVHAADNLVYLEDLQPINSDRYTGNEGDSFIDKIGRRNGNVDVSGNSYSHGLTAWVARWNSTNEVSWVWNEYDIAGGFGHLQGKIVLIKSYNETDFITKLEIIGDGRILYSIDLTPNSLPTSDLQINVNGVSKLTIKLHDNKSVSGGTAFGLVDFRLVPDPLNSASSWAHDGIKSAIDKGFVPQDLQKSYTNVITRTEFCRLAIKWLEFKTGKDIGTLVYEKGLSIDSNAFSDTNDPDILAAYTLGITSGTKAPTGLIRGTFAPNGAFSREQAATMIRNTCRIAGLDVSNVTPAGFDDIGSASSWAVDSINFCYNNGIMTGTRTSPLTFSTKSTYTREESIITFNNIK